MTAIFTLTIFLSAALLFVIQPLVAKALLPVLGGSPAVWNTCMVFFQVTLLGGYAFSHVLTTRLRPRAQVLVHAAIVLAAIALLPIVRPAGWTPPTDSSQALWLLGLLAVMAGLPFFVVSTAGPLLQRWFAGTTHRHAHDPYFLYAASNAGSLLGLLAYPVVIEPTLTLSTQARGWMVLYLALAAGLIACGVVHLVRARRDPGAPVGLHAEPVEVTGHARHGPVTVRRRLLWIALAFVPSSLMIGATQHLTTDIAAIPLLWVVPLAIYLVSFIVAFARRWRVPARWLSRSLPILVLALATASLLNAHHPVWLLMLMDLGVLLVVALLCHTRLADDRPRADHLTEYFLLMSVGGALGGIFNALVAPTIFNGVYEYPIAIVLACMLRLPAERPASSRSRRLDIVLPIVLAAVMIGLAMLSVRSGIDGTVKGNALQFGIPLVGAFLLVTRPIRFALGMAVLLGFGIYNQDSGYEVLLRDRTFFGVLTVRNERVEVTIHQPHGMSTTRVETYRVLKHGTTYHGFQSLDPDRADIPLTYYFPAGPIGQVMTTFADSPIRRRVGVVGLGAGTLAAYSKPGERWTFYEIDPEVVRIARDPAYFTYLQRARGELDYVIGDGRLSIEAEPDGAIGILVIDAFSSDAIPVHMLTTEAIALYRQKVRDDGIIALHISNRHLDLARVVAAIARDLDMAGRIEESYPTDQQDDEQMFASTWVILARDESAFGPLAHDTRWQRLAPRPGDRAWTDAYSNLLGVFDWN